MNHSYIQLNPECAVLTHPEVVSGGTIPAIPSKSHAHRLLIAAALSDAPGEIICPVTSKDIDATASCLSSMGADIHFNGNRFSLEPVRLTDKNKMCRLSVGESGSTLRFLLPVLGALGISAELHMEGRLPDRPLSPLYEELCSHGMRISPRGSNPLLVSGQLSSGTYTIDGGISSQYITGLLFALPLLSGDSLLEITGRLESRPYVEITLQVLRQFGIRIEPSNEFHEKKDAGISFRIPGGQTYHRDESDCTVEADWSNAAFFLTAGAILPVPVTVTGCNTASAQGDRRIVELLKEFGAEVTFTPSAVGDALTDISVKGNALKGIIIHAADIPDLVPILAVAASYASGTTIIREIRRLRIKESDRVATILEMLSGLGADIRECRETDPDVASELKKAGLLPTEDEACLLIRGTDSLSGGRVSSHNDHRIAMAAAIASLRAESPVEILQPMAVTKSYPGFYQDLSCLFAAQD